MPWRVRGSWKVITQLLPGRMSSASSPKLQLTLLNSLGLHNREAPKGIPFLNPDEQTEQDCLQAWRCRSSIWLMGKVL